METALQPPAPGLLNEQAGSDGARQYASLVSAMKLLDAAQYAVWQDEATSPAWRLLINARHHIQQQAETILREIRS